MNICNKVRDAILTDYLDKEKEGQSFVDEHLASCSSCREFLALAKEVTIDPLEKAQGAMISQDELWVRIRQEIDAEEEVFERYSFGNLGNWLHSVFVPAKPVLAFSAFTLLVVTLAVFNIKGNGVDLVRKRDGSAYTLVKASSVGTLQDVYQDEYFTYLFSDEESGFEYGKSLETYFL